MDKNIRLAREDKRISNYKGSSFRYSQKNDII